MEKNCDWIKLIIYIQLIVLNKIVELTLRATLQNNLASKVKFKSNTVQTKTHRLWLISEFFVRPLNVY